jgi:HD-GYP domain-containing protein (c-di-GMP phosphodiesterase class II)
MKLKDQVKIVHFGSIHREFFKKITSRLDNRWTLVVADDADLGDCKADERESLIIVSDQDHARKPGWLANLRNGKLKDTLCAVLMISAPDEEVPAVYDGLIEYLEPPLVPWRTIRALLGLAAALANKKEIGRLQANLSLRRQEIAQLSKIGVALSAERDPNKLLEMILTEAREITNADAGSLYLVEKNPDIPANENNFWTDKQLRFKLAQNDSLSASYQEFVMPVEKKSMAGYAALTGEYINIEDAYTLPEDSEIQHNRSFDEKMGYRTKSVFCVPMRSHLGETIGVLQLINRKRDFTAALSRPEAVDAQVIPFDQRCVEMASSLAGQAAVSIENVRLYEEITRLFEGFIVASVHAIEQRDPTTSGHSERVAKLTVGLAKEVDRLDDGPFRSIRFTRDDIQQLNYASLLHDFGKIGVREHVLVKAKKLYPEQLDAIKFRFQFIKKAMESQNSRRKVQRLLEQSKEEALKHLGILDEDFKAKLFELDSYLALILEANEPRVLAEGSFEKLADISRMTFQDDGVIEPFLQEDEVHFLSIPRGSLSEEERVEIESHVTHTYNFLSKIPWASHLKEVPKIAYAHHEKLDGTGYPRRLASPQIPLPSKMMTISDIFDALTASDRPYKRAVPTDRALGILESEMKEGKLDQDLLKIFIEAEIYKLAGKSEGL